MDLNYWRDYWDDISQDDKDYVNLKLQYGNCDHIDKYRLVADFVGRDSIPLSESGRSVLNMVVESFELNLEEKGRENFTTPETIENALSAVSPIDDSDEYNREKVIQNMLVDMKLTGSTKVQKRAYFIAGEEINFRHQGKNDKKPKCVFLRNLDLEEYREKVLVYYSASGSGKTVELAGSSVTRNAHITFIIRVEDPEPQLYDTQFFDQACEKWDRELKRRNEQNEQFNSEEEKEREKDKFISQQISRAAADKSIIEALVELVQQAKNELKRLIVAAKKQKEKLKIVLAIDEGISCTRMIRGILRHTKLSAISVKEAFDRVFGNTLTVMLEELDVKTSIAGTGVSASTIGSVPDNFAILPPFHELEGREFHFLHYLNKAGKNFFIPWIGDSVRINSFDVFADCLPVVATLIQNGRMASITFDELDNYNKSDPLCESALVDRIVKRYMLSNGMVGLMGDEHTVDRQHVAAAALAVHLFGNMDRFRVTVPVTSQEVEEFARRMLFFPLAGEKYNVNIRRIVTRYGLLEPEGMAGDDFGCRISPPLKMQVAQQLVAAHMLGIGLDSMLEPSWIGFEVMSTHFVNCAIAASVAVHETKRPSLAETLDCLGIRKDPIATSKNVVSELKELDEWIAIGTLPHNEDKKNIFHSETRQLYTALQIVNNDYLEVDRVLYDSIMTLQKRPAEFGKAIACLNYGSSNLPDGFVTFFAVKKGSDVSHKVSIMIQAKDYHGNSSLNVKKLNEHAKVARHKALNGLFGKKRVLCVASSHESLLCRQKAKLSRDFIPYDIQNSKMLKNLLKDLKEKRSLEFRKKNYCLHCNENADKMNFTDLCQSDAKRQRKI